MFYNLLSSRTNFRYLHLIKISNACYSNDTHLFSTLHGMHGVRGSNSLGSISNTGNLEVRNKEETKWYWINRPV